MQRFSFVVVLLLACGFLPSWQSLEAAEFLSGIEVIVGPDEVINEDVYAYGGRIVIEGTINGDLVAAGESIEVSGAVNGDLITAARLLTIGGTVEDDIRAAGAELRYSSQVGGDIITSGNEITIESAAVVGEDLVVNAITFASFGEVEGSLELSAVDARIDGSVRGNVAAEVEDSLVLGPESSIGGELNYTSINEAGILPGAAVTGDITQQIPAIELFGNEFQVTAIIVIFQTIIAQAKWFLGVVIVGLLLLWIFPATTADMRNTLAESPWKSLFAGALTLVLVPVLLLLLMIITLSVVGFPAFAIVAVPGTAYLVMLLLAKPLVAVPIGGFIAKHVTGRESYSPRSALVIGVALMAVLGCFPYIDTVVGYATLIAGFGMSLLFFFRRYRAARASQYA